MIRILLVDDQNLVQQGIKSLLEQDQNFKVIGTVEDGKSAIKQINLLRPDIVLLDIEMPGMNGITVTKYINHFLPDTKVIILSSHEEKKYLVQALVAGARSYILKSSLMNDLKQAILAVDNGYSLIESRLLSRVLNSGTAKLVPVRSETTQDNSKQRIEESTQLNDHNCDESDFLLLHRDKAIKETDEKLVEDNLPDVASASVLISSEDTQKNNISRKIAATEQSETAKKIDNQNSNLENVSKIDTVNNSNSANSIRQEVEANCLDISEPEQKSKIQLDSKNSSLKTEDKDDITLSDQSKLQEFKQDVSSSPLYNINLDKPSYHDQIGGINQIGLQTVKEEDETALVPVSLPPKSNDRSKIIFGSNVARSKTKFNIAKSYLRKIYNRSEIQRLKTQILRIIQLILSKLGLFFAQYIQPIVSKYEPFINQYKSRFLRLIRKRSTQKILWNIGLVIFGVIVVLIIYNL